MTRDDQLNQPNYLGTVALAGLSAAGVAASAFLIAIIVGPPLGVKALVVVVIAYAVALVAVNRLLRHALPDLRVEVTAKRKAINSRVPRLLALAGSPWFDRFLLLSASNAVGVGVFSLGLDVTHGTPVVLDVSVLLVTAVIVFTSVKSVTAKAVAGHNNAQPAF